jgi:hypothetical protein
MNPPAKDIQDPKSFEALLLPHQKVALKDLVTVVPNFGFPHYTPSRPPGMMEEAIGKLEAAFGPSNPLVCKTTLP